ncbi:MULTISPECIES: hypothetical protein [unclassified Cryobacterium]|uniref:hypothetical protein n=2 Tax=Cryobacterium TaxID=69578 RepID=UPI00106AFE21|nr:MULTISPECIES: hypothetical protein [unclassified Cryobacterium]TFC58691.1 hypothetical protein E3O68_01735 [Cryobacterium sp. TMB3-1-2]TFC67112.1 hypothetical protein E3T21_16595 [Cryobacterium sp. TMB3-15]TFC73375.1 hypothetical protein E3T22_17460 [Cryobacterium sp. TMB3-10]TFD44152.1 hypothetical protein E3T58_05510 [Cryobacterium sp. TMB3-12]
MTEPGTDASDQFDDSLTNPSGIYVLRERNVPGGRMEVSGYANFQGMRLRVRGVSRDGRVSVAGDLPLSGVFGREQDPRVGVAFGRVDFGWLSRFWLTRTTSFDLIDETTPQPGLMASIGGLTVGLVDTDGTVSAAGVPQLQLIWLGAVLPTGEGWAPDGYGMFTRLVDRSLVAVVHRVEWTAIWRDFTVQIAAVRNGRAVIFVGGGGEPPLNAPEVVLGGGHRTNGWSAVVPLAQLSLRGWTLTESPLGVGVVAACVGTLRGRTASMVRVAGPHVAGEEPVAAPGRAIVVKKDRGDTVTDEFVLAASSLHFWTWRVTVDESEVSDLRQVTATTTWNGQTHPVQWRDDGAGLVYLDSSTVDIADTTPFIYTVQPIDRSALPVDSRAL